MDEQNDVKHGDTFDTGTEVKAHGHYVCAPCGYKKVLERGETFPECDSCMQNASSEEDDEEERGSATGIWEYVGEGEEDEK